MLKGTCKIIKQKNLFITILIIACHLAGIRSSKAQTNAEGYAIPLQRLKLKLVSSNLYFTLQGQLDLDSVTILAANGEHLPFSLYYDEDYTDRKGNEVSALLAKGARYLFKAGADKADLDKAIPFLLSAEEVANKTKDVYWQNAALALLGKYYLQLNDLPKAKASFSRAIALARQAGNESVLCQALSNSGTYASYGDPQKEKDLNESLQLSRKLRNKVREIEMITRIYEIYFIQGRFDTVRQELLHVTELEKAIGFKDLQYNYNVLAYLDMSLGNYSMMLPEADTAVKMMEANHDFAFSNLFYTISALVYGTLQDYDQSRIFTQKCIDNENQNFMKRSWYGQYIRIAHLLAFTRPKEAIDLINSTNKKYPPVFDLDKMNILHVLGLSYQTLGQFSVAKKYYAEMLPYFDKLKNDPAAGNNLFFSHMDMAILYCQEGNVHLARSFFKEGQKYWHTNNEEYAFRKLFVQYKIDSLEKNYASALRNYQQYRLIDDSLFTINKTRQMTEQSVRYETESKDKNILFLTEKDKAQQTSLRQSEIIRNFTIAGIILMALLTLLIYMQYRNKQRSNREINEKNEALNQLVKDKDWLVKEIHHRVKNNLQTIVSLLESQSVNLKDDALGAVQDSRNRIYAMSLIHQKLYKKDFESTIDLASFLPDLVDNLKDSFDVKQRIRFTLNIESMVLNISQATPVGLILNEAIINAIKYAFPGKTAGNEIQIYIGYGMGNDIVFEVSDNGIGLPDDFEERAEAGLGIKLMRGLTGELHGHFYINRQKGTKISIRFTPKSIMNDVA